MSSKTVILDIKDGLQSKIASKFVKTAMSFRSNISIECNGITADAKCIINVLALRLPYRAKVKIAAIGVDEALAVEKLSRLIS